MPRVGTRLSPAILPLIDKDFAVQHYVMLQMGRNSKQVYAAIIRFRSKISCLNLSAAA